MTRRDIEETLAEEAERAEREDTAEEGRHVYRKPRTPREPSQVYSLRIPVDRLEDLRTVAAAAGEAPSALMRSWVLERLDHAEGASTVSVRLAPAVQDRLKEDAARAGLSLENYAAQLLAMHASDKAATKGGPRKRKAQRDAV